MFLPLSPLCSFLWRSQRGYSDERRPAVPHEWCKENWPCSGRAREGRPPLPVPHPSRSLLPLRVIRAPPCALGRRAPAPRAACAPAASPLRRSGTGHPALDFRWKIGEGNDGFEGVEDANRRHGFGLGLGGGTATGCATAANGGILPLYPGQQLGGGRLVTQGRRSRGTMPPQSHHHNLRQVLG